MNCLFGGTFDPVHLGHVHGALRVCDALDLSEIRLVLSAYPAHRDPTGASVDQRWQMLCLACAADSRLVADDCEVRRDRPSFTVDTLEGVRAETGDRRLLWVIGSDAFADLPVWYRWQDVLKLCSLVVLARPGHDADYPGILKQLVQQHRVSSLSATEQGEIFFLGEDMQPASASEIRRELSLGHDMAHLLNPQVAAYISRHGLYGVARGG